MFIYLNKICFFFFFSLPILFTYSFFSMKSQFSNIIFKVIGDDKFMRILICLVDLVQRHIVRSHKVPMVKLSLTLRIFLIKRHCGFWSIIVIIGFLVR
jgi:hypothetical protein